MNIFIITFIQFHYLHMVNAEYEIIYDPKARKNVVDKAHKKDLWTQTRSNISVDILESPTELYYYNLYIKFIENSNIHPKKMKTLLDGIFDDYDNLIPGFVNGIQSEVDLNLDLFWLDQMSPRDSTYSSGFSGQVHS